MGILVMWNIHFHQTSVSPAQGGSTCNLISIGPVVSEEMSFENVDADVNADTDVDADTDVEADTDDRPLPILSAPQEPSALVS